MKFLRYIFFAILTSLTLVSCGMLKDLKDKDVDSTETTAPAETAETAETATPAETTTPTETAETTETTAPTDTVDQQPVDKKFQLQNGLKSDIALFIGNNGFTLSSGKCYTIKESDAAKMRIAFPTGTPICDSDCLSGDSIVTSNEEDMPNRKFLIDLDDELDCDATDNEEISG